MHDKSRIWNRCAALLFNVWWVLSSQPWPKFQSPKKILNQPTDPVFFHLGDRKQEIFGAAYTIWVSISRNSSKAISSLHEDDLCTARSEPTKAISQPFLIAATAAPRSVLVLVWSALITHGILLVTITTSIHDGLWYNSKSAGEPLPSSIVVVEILSRLLRIWSIQQLFTVFYVIQKMSQACTSHKLIPGAPNLRCHKLTHLRFVSLHALHDNPNETCIFQHKLTSSVILAEAFGLFCSWDGP